MAKCSKCGSQGEWIGSRYSLSIKDGKFICCECLGENITRSPIIGRTFFSPEFGREISNTEIKKLCKEKGYVYADDKDLTADCKRNKEYTEHKQMESFRNTVIENTMRELS